MSPDQTKARALEALEPISNKLTGLQVTSDPESLGSKEVTIEEQVERLIREARNPHNLGSMYVGVSELIRLALSLSSAGTLADHIMLFAVVRMVLSGTSTQARHRATKPTDPTTPSSKTTSLFPSPLFRSLSYRQLVVAYTLARTRFAIRVLHIRNVG